MENLCLSRKSTPKNVVKDVMGVLNYVIEVMFLVQFMIDKRLVVNDRCIRLCDWRYISCFVSCCKKTGVFDCVTKGIFLACFVLFLVAKKTRVYSTVWLKVYNSSCLFCFVSCCKKTGVFDCVTKGIFLACFVLFLVAKKPRVYSTLWLRLCFLFVLCCFLLLKTNLTRWLKLCLLFIMIVLSCCKTRVYSTIYVIEVMLLVCFVLFLVVKDGCIGLCHTLVFIVLTFYFRM